MKLGATALVAFVSALLGAGVGAWSTHAQAASLGSGTAPGAAVAPLGNLVTAAEKIAPTVVSIDLYGGEDKDKNPLAPQSEHTMVGHGSGVIITPDGVILTNNHVVKAAERIQVTLPGDESGYPARVLGNDPLTDLAVVQLEKLESGRQLPYLTFGDSDKCRIGEWLVAVGNPYGVGHTVTVGVLSGRGKRLPGGKAEMTDMLQTDAAINPGNSGGPLCNSQAEIIGINTAIIPYAQGIGFSVPSKTALWVTERLRAKGKVVRPYLGVQLGRLTPEAAKVLELPAGSGGVVVKKSLTGSPAQKAGLDAGDVVLKLDGQAVADPEQFTRAVSQHEPGSTLKIELMRQGQAKAVEVKLIEMPNQLPAG